MVEVIEYSQRMGQRHLTQNQLRDPDLLFLDNGQRALDLPETFEFRQLVGKFRECSAETLLATGLDAGADESSAGSRKA